jgi:hypothetical protein
MVLSQSTDHIATLYGSDRFLRTLLRVSITVLRVSITVLRTQILRSEISFTGFYRKLYGHGILSFLLCVLSIALSVTSIPTTDFFVVLGLYAVLLLP